MLHTSFVSPNCGVITFLVAFQTHNLCGLRRKRFVGQFWRHLLILSFLTSFYPALCYDLHINRTLCIYGIGPLYACVREGYEGGVWGSIDSYARSSIYGLPSEACVIIKLVVFRDG